VFFFLNKQMDNSLQFNKRNLETSIKAKQ